MRVAIFVDGGAMFYAQRAVGWHIDFRLVHQYFTDNREKAGAYYFTASPPAPNLRAVESYRRFRSALIHMGYSVIDKEVSVIKDDLTGQVKLKGNLDIELVFRMITGADGYDEAVLLGGDRDYVPVVEHLRNIGKTVICVGVRRSTAEALLNVVSKFVDVEEIRDRIEKRR